MSLVCFFWGPLVFACTLVRFTVTMCSLVVFVYVIPFLAIRRCLEWGVVGNGSQYNMYDDDENESGDQDHELNDAGSIAATVAGWTPLDKALAVAARGDQPIA